MADTFSCPECGVKLRRSPALRPGERVQCPKCSVQFSVPEAEADAPPPPPPLPPRADIERDPPPRGTRRAEDRPVRGSDRYDDDFDRPARRRRDDDDEDYADV